MTNIDAVGAPAPPPPPPCQNPKVELEVEEKLLTLKHFYKSRLTITVTPESCPVTGYKIEIQRASGGSWYTLSTSSTFQWRVKVAGKFKLRGTATVNGSEVQSSTTDVEVQFPSYDQIVGDGELVAALRKEWVLTLKACRDKPSTALGDIAVGAASLGEQKSTREERGCFIRVDTEKNVYVLTNHATPIPVGPLSGAGIMLGPRPPDQPASPEPDAKGVKYVVASFHTHTPTTYLPAGDTRGVGPSSADDTNNDGRQIPGVVYDYVEDSAGSGEIPTGHPKPAAARLYRSGSVARRPTP